MQQFEKIPRSAPDSVKYAAFYNSGIIAQKQSDYEEAKKYFKKALEIDNTRIEAKINMELAMEMAQGVVKQNQSSTTQVQEEKEELPDLDKALFKHIRENDQKQWKNSEPTTSQNSADDF
jgi:tetratricopeptide (TPR) repeat protein